MKDYMLPAEWIPTRLRPDKKPRPNTMYIAAYDDGVTEYSHTTFRGPLDDLEEILNTIPPDKTRRSFIIRLNMDGTDTLLYQWTLGNPHRWRRFVAR